MNNNVLLITFHRGTAASASASAITELKQALLFFCFVFFMLQILKNLESSFNVLNVHAEGSN